MKAANNKNLDSLFFIIALFVVAFVSFSFRENHIIQQNGMFDAKLKTELDSMLELDQRIRRSMDKFEKDFAFNSPEMDSIWIIQTQIDNSNMVRISDIIDKQGYPGVSLVGVETSLAAFFIIQHADLENQKKYFPILKKSSENNELSKTSVAMLQDRILMFEGKPQIYGSQAKGDRFFDAVRNEYIDTLYVWHIENPDSVNYRRKELGFKTTVEENAAQMGLKYKSNFND